MHSATIFVALAAVVATASAWGGAIDIYARPSYRTAYAVSDKLTGDHKSASEVRDGDVTKGSYSVLQPDGVTRVVKYIVTPLGGFQAQVINKGVAAHPAVIGAGAIKGIGAVGLGGVGLGLGNGLLAAPLGLGLGLGGWSSVQNVGPLGSGWGWGNAQSVVRVINSPVVTGGWGWGGATSVVNSIGSPVVGGWGLGWGAGILG